MVAVMRSKRAKSMQELREADIDRALVLVCLQGPGNIGALLRTADAAGIDAVVLVDMALDLYNPNIIRSSTGACFRDNIYQLSSDEALTLLKGEGFQIAAADVAGGRSLYEVDILRQVRYRAGRRGSGTAARLGYSRRRCLAQYRWTGPSATRSMYRFAAR